MIADRRAGRAGSSERRKDLLTQMIEQAEASGGATTDGQVRATFMMWFGADQLHAMFTWALHLLALNPDVEARCNQELDEVLGGRPPTAADIALLPYTRKVLKEAMRVYPPVWGFFRQLTADYRLGDQLIPKGHLIGFSPWATHRDPALWPDPLRFDPGRWDDGAERPPELSYFPFSAGPYECHGRRLAMVEAVLVMAALGQTWSFRHADAQPPRPTATWATEPKKGLRMVPVARRGP